MKAIGVVRVSETGDREDARLASPDEQTGRIGRLCETEGLDLLRVVPEIDVSGGAALTKRAGLRGAVEAIERGEASVIVVAYFDRLVRSLRVQEEVVSRVEAAGGRVLAADFGQVTNGTASKWLSSTMLGMVAEYQRRSTAERTAAAQAQAIAQGRPPYPLIPGLRRTPEGGVELDPMLAPVVRRAFEMRAENKPIRVVREYLAAHGVRRSYSALAKMFGSSLAVGEIRYGVLRGKCGAALIDDELFARVQEASSPRGRYSKQSRLLARLGVLRCATCNARMSVDTKTTRGRKPYPFYRCTNVDCTARATVGALNVERLVVEEVHRLTADIRGRASSASSALGLRVIAERDQTALENAIEAFDAFGAQPVAKAKLARLGAAADQSRAAAERAERMATKLEISVGKNWDDLTLDEQRDLVAALIESVMITPGRSPDRIVIRSAALGE